MTLEEIFSALTEAGTDNRDMGWVKSAGRLYAVYQILDDKGVPLNTFIWELPASAKWGEGEADPVIRLSDGTSYLVPRSAREVNGISTYIDQDIDSRIANNVMRMDANPNGVDVLNEIAAALRFDDEITEIMIPSLGYYVDLDGNPTTREPDWYKQAKEANSFLADWWSEDMLEQNLEDIPNPAYQVALDAISRNLEGFLLEKGVIYAFPLKEDGVFDYDKGVPVPSTLQVQDPLFNTLSANLDKTKSAMSLYGTVDPDLGEDRFFTKKAGDTFVKQANENEKDPDAGLYYLKPVTVNGKTYWDRETRTRPVEEAETTYRRFLVDNFSTPELTQSNARSWAMQKSRIAPYTEHDAYEIYGDQGSVLGWEVRPVHEDLVSGEKVGANARAGVEAEIKAKNNPNLFVDWRTAPNGDKIYFASKTTDGSRKLTPEQIASYQEQGYAVTESLDHPGLGFYKISDSPTADPLTWFGDDAGRAAGEAWLKKNDPKNEHWTLVMQDNDRWGLEEVPDYVGTLYGTSKAADRNVPAGFQTVPHWNADGTQSWGYERIPEEEGPGNFDELVYSVALTQGGAAALTIDAFRDQVNAAQMSFGQAAQLAVQYGKNATQMKNILKVLLAPPAAFDSTDFDRVMANAGNALAGTPGYSVSEAAKQFESVDALAGFATTALDIPSPFSEYQEPRPVTAQYTPTNQDEIDAMVKAGNDWWNFNKRDQAWLDNLTTHISETFMAEQWSESRPTVVSPDGTEYKNIGEAREPLKWEKVKVAQPEEPSGYVASAASTKQVTDVDSEDVLSRGDAFINALTAGDEYKDKDKNIKYKVGAAQSLGA
jgi:hypothetical protein